MTTNQILAMPRLPKLRNALLGLVTLVVGIGLGGYVAADMFSTPAGVPRLLTYEGYLTQNGSPVADGQHDLFFRLFTTETGGSPVWQWSRSVATSGGHFVVTLGDTRLGSPALSETTFSGGDVWIEIAVATSGEVVGRQRVHSVPYALRAAEASHAERSTAADSATNSVHASSADTSASSTRSDTLRDNSVYMSQNCVNSTVDTVCYCDTDSIAISGGFSYQTSHSISTSTNGQKLISPPSRHMWVMTCVSGGSYTSCPGAHAMCIRTSP